MAVAVVIEAPGNDDVFNVAALLWRFPSSWKPAAECPVGEIPVILKPNADVVMLISA